MTTRHEKVILDLEDRFTRPTAQAAAAAALLSKELNSLSGSAVKTSASTSRIERDVAKVGKSADTSGKQIDRLSGRLALLVRAATILGPALVPIGATAIPAISGMATQLTVAAGAAGVAVLAFKGLGEGIKTLNAYQLEPTSENLEKMRLAMEKLGPAGAEFARFLDAVGPQFRELRMTAREGMFPGMEEGITSLLTLLPQVNRIVGEIATAMGDLSASAGAGLAGERFAEFFNYLESEAGPILMEMGRTIGNFADGLAAMMVAFGPLSASFSGGLESMSAAFADWAHGLDSSSSFQEFVTYIAASAPKVMDLLGSLVDAFVSVATAVAPIGDAVVPALTAMLDVISAIASSPIGPTLLGAVAALNAYATAASIATAASTGMAASMVAGSARGVAAMWAMRAEIMALGVQSATTATSLAAMASTIAGFSLVGAAVGFSYWLDTADDVTLSVQEMDAALKSLAAGEVAGKLNELSFAADSLGEALQQAAWNDLHFMDAAEEVKALDQAMAQLAASNPGAAADAFATIAAEAQKAGLNTDELAGIFPRYTAAAGAAEAASRDEAAATNSAAQAARAHTQALQENISAMRTKRAETLRAANAEINYEASIDDATKAARENGRTLDITTEKGRANRSALLNQAAAWNGLSNSAKNTKGAHQQAIGAFVATAVQMGMNEGKARKYARSLMEIPAKRVTVLTLQDLATAALARARRELNAMNGLTATMYLNTVRTGAGGQGAGYKPSADGGTVPRTGLPYADRHPYLLADGEEVISNRNGQADRHRSLLKAINAGRLADGGTTGGLSTHNRSGMNFDPLGVAANRATRELHGLAGMSKQELTQRQKALNQRQKLLESEVARHKERLDMLKQERQAIVDAVKSAYTSDVFGGSSQQYPEWMDADAIAEHEAVNRSNALTNNIADMKEALRLLKVLRRRGLNGSAYMDLAAQGDVQMLQAYVDMSKAELAQYERQYDQRNRLASQLGNYVGDAEYGSDIKAARADRREANRLLSRVESRLEALEKHAKDAPKKTGQEVGKAVNGAATAGQRGRG